MFSLFHIHKPAHLSANHPELIEHAGDFDDLDAARARASAVLDSPLSGYPARVEIDSSGKTVEIVRKVALRPVSDFWSWYTGGNGQRDPGDAGDFDVPARGEDD